MKIKTPTKGRVKRELDKRAPKLVETGKKTLILQGTKTSGTLNSVLSEIYHLKKGGAVSYDKKIAPRVGSKPFIAFIGEGFENVDELKHLKEVLLYFLRGEVVENINLAGLDRVYVCTTISSNKVYLTHCALQLKKSGTVVPRMELVEVGPSMDLVVRRHRLPNEGLRKEAMKTAKDQPKKKVGELALPNKAKGVKSERREAKNKEANEHASKKQKEESE
ncbi:hypothetical protein ES319_A01G228400v1 [Gossypium barbadense]|uniref:Ribosome production factor 2 homolog n=1 Tax=Gossypium barbadense TaxID=3634 RepID=A0A5J5WZY8_GOSBA|nr:hypothetical protein ES319_A01G228400v1 [Gossypium barbadense]